MSSVAWTFQVQTAAFGAVLLLNLLNLGMRQHLLPFKCNLLLLYINGVAFVTDLLLWRDATTVLMSSSGRPFAPLRYVQWCHSTPTMIYMLALLADCSGWQLATPLLSDVVMVLTGLVACYTAGPLKLLATLLSFGTFGVVLYYVYGMFHRTLSDDVSPEQRSTLRTVLALLLALWSAFPVVWLASEWQLMGPQAEAVAWGVCDYLAKVVFSSQLWQSNLTEVQLRRDRALEAWEASNRVEAVARLTALLKQRDDLLSTLSHELRTPLAGIVALSEGLCQEVSAALPSSAQNLATVRATATCMLNIVTSTLDSFAARRGGEPAAAPGAAASLVPYYHPDDDAGPAAPSVPLSPLDLRPLVETVTTVLRPLAHDGVAIVSDLPANLPPVAADVTRLSQVLYNLVGNAMRFTTHGEVRIAARVVLPEASDGPAAAPPPQSAPSPPPASAPSTRCADSATGDLAAATAATAASANSISSSGGGGGGGIWRYARPRLSVSSMSSCSSSCATSLPPGSQVEVSVEDTGVGIAQELLDELFLPYRTGQAASQGADAASCGGFTARVSKSIGGTGLGLYLVRLALRAQGSDITAESAPGIGSVFRFRLPVTQQPQQQPRPSQHLERQPSGRHAGLTQQQQQQQPRRRGISLDERRRVEDGLSGTQAPLSGSACECGGGGGARSSRTLSGATTATSEGCGAPECGGCGLHAPMPAPCVPVSPKPWIASATARLVRLSAGRGGGSGGGAAAAGPAEPQRPRTGTLPLREGRSPTNSRMLRMSLDESHSRPPPSCPPLPPGGGARCRSACAGGCYTPAAEPSPAGCAARGSAGGAPEPRNSGPGSGVAADAAPAPTSAGATAAASGGSGGAGGASLGALATTTSSSTPARVATPALAPTPAQTPTAAAAARISAATPFDVAHAVEEGRALARGGLRPNFRHRNNGVLQVLSVDDDPINQLVAGQMLTSQSWKVVKCMNGPEALAHLQLHLRPGTAAAAAAAPSPTGPLAAAAAAAAQALLLPTVLPDCVLLDVMMPGMSGFEVCRKLREHFSSAQLPIIIVSAKGDTAAVDEAFESGADDYMTKPYKRTEMVARIKAQIRTRDSLLEAAAAAAATATAAPPLVSAASVCSAPPPGGAAPAAELASASAASLGAVPAGGSLRAPSSAMTARSLLGCASDLPSPPPPSLPLPPLSQDSRPTSADMLLMQQTTPDSIKMHMEVSRCGVDGSWGKVGLYKREGAPSRTGGAPEASSMWDAAARAGPAREPATAPAAVPGSPCGGPPPLGDAGSAAAAAAVPAAPQSSDLSGVLNKRRAVTADAVVGTSRPLQALPEGTVIVPSVDIDPAATTAPGAMPPIVVLSAGAPAATADGSSAGGAVGGDASGGESSAATALMREVLTEVRRSRVVEADIEKLTSRVSALRTACCTLAAERDGWRRQARDLRALLAAGISGGAAAAEALAAGVAAAPTSGTATVSAKGTPLHLTLTEALAAAHGSRSSGDSLAINIGLGGGGGGGAGGAAQGPPGGAVAAQLEDLKKEAALLRQQLSLALASVGHGSGGSGGLALGPADTGGSRTFGLASSGVPPAVRRQRSLLPAPRTCDSPQSAAMPGDGAGAGEAGERSGGGVADGPPTWGVSVYPNPSFAPPDMFLTTETSGLSAGSGPGGCASGEGGAGKRAPSSSHPSAGADGSPNDCKLKGLRGRAASPPKAATATRAVATAAPGPRPAPDIPPHSAAAKQANGAGADAPSPPTPILAGFGSTVVCGVAEISLPSPPAAPPPQPPPPPSKATDPQPLFLGELRGSSAASNGGWRSSVEEEMSQPSSAGRASGVPPSSRGYRARGGGGGAAGGGGGGTAGILRLLCSKGAVPSGSPPSSPPRRPSQQQSQHPQ